MSQDRIAELAVSQCETGVFGDVNCESLPKAYTDSGGGCDGKFYAQTADYSVDVFAIHRAEAEERQQAVAELNRKQAEERRKHYAELDRGTRCRQEIERQIFSIESRIHAGADPNGHRLELKRLRAKLGKCGPSHHQPEVPPPPGGYLKRIRQ